jgi:hypothetical protein
VEQLLSPSPLLRRLAHLRNQRMLQLSRNPRPTPPKSLHHFSVLLPPQAQGQQYHHPRRQNKMHLVTRMRLHSSITFPFAGSIPVFYPLSRKLSSLILSWTLRTSWNNTKSIVSRCNRTTRGNLLTRGRRALPVHQANLLFLLPRSPSLNPPVPPPPRCRCLRQASQASDRFRILLHLQQGSGRALQLQPIHLLSTFRQQHPILNLCRLLRPHHFPALVQYLRSPRSNQLRLIHRRRPSPVLPH